MVQFLGLDGHADRPGEYVRDAFGEPPVALPERARLSGAEDGQSPHSASLDKQGDQQQAAHILHRHRGLPIFGHEGGIRPVVQQTEIATPKGLQPTRWTGHLIVEERLGAVP